jgi:hypothetical protein
MPAITAELPMDSDLTLDQAYITAARAPRIHAFVTISPATCPASATWNSSSVGIIKKRHSQPVKGVRRVEVKTIVGDGHRVVVHDARGDLPHDRGVVAVPVFPRQHDSDAAAWQLSRPLRSEGPPPILRQRRKRPAGCLEPNSFDLFVAFEVVEHGDYSMPIYELLKPDGRLMATTPVPRFDPLCRALEAFGMVQRRTSPHTHLIDLRRFPRIGVSERQINAGVSEWAILRPLHGPAADF